MFLNDNQNHNKTKTTKEDFSKQNQYLLNLPSKLNKFKVKIVLNFLINRIFVYFSFNLNHIQIFKYIKSQQMFPSYPNNNIYFPNQYYIQPEPYYYQPQPFNPYNFVMPQNAFCNFSAQQNIVPVSQPLIVPKIQHEPTVVQIKPVRIDNICCNCINTDCRKQYCICFKNGQICGPKCGCTQCRNATLIDRKVFAGTGNKVSCKCKKSQCSKKYCQCFAYGLKCGQNCKCQSCKNCQ